LRNLALVKRASHFTIDDCGPDCDDASDGSHGGVDDGTLMAATD
jgi:hypothetical protein